MLGEGLRFTKHSAVIAAFGQHFIKTGRVAPEYHRYLIAAENERNVSDYDYSVELTAAQAQVQLARAELFLRLADHLIGPFLPPPEMP